MRYFSNWQFDAANFDYIFQFGQSIPTVNVDNLVRAGATHTPNFVNDLNDTSGLVPEFENSLSGCSCCGCAAQFKEAKSTLASDADGLLGIDFDFGASGKDLLLSNVVGDGPLFLDVPGSILTTETLAVEGTTTNTLETANDEDWFKVTLQAGVEYIISLTGSGGTILSDPLVRILDNTGVELAMNDDAGGGRNSILRYTPTTTDTYYISAEAWTTQTGDYTLSLNTVRDYTLDEIAFFLTNTYRGRQAFDHNDITYDISGLRPGAQTLAIMAMEAFAAVTPLTFTAVTGGATADIFFDDEDSGAYASNTVSNFIITHSNVNISKTWSGGTTDVDDYTYQTFIHEIGHALGLGHAGPYNGSATYGVDNVYLNDSWTNSVMSYMHQVESGQGSYRFVLGLQMGDIIAMQNLYGTNGSTRTGDSVYGFNSTETDVHDFSQFTRAPSLAIYDEGGTDTLDFSNYSSTQRIDLRQETFSDVDGLTNVISIARGTVIENAIGGSGVDTITGNAADNELTGGVGNDILDGGAGTDYALYSGSSINNYTVTDNGDGTFTVTDNVGTDGADTLSNIEFIRVASIDYPIDGFPPASLTPGNDTYTATTGADIIFGLDGDDTISGLSGDDVIDGEGGVDTIYGGSGNDTLFGGTGNDARIDGGAGNDTLYGGDGDDNLYGQLGDDIVNGGAGNDFVTGSNGADILNGDAGDDLLIGGNGNDIMDGGLDVDRLAGGAGDDNLVGGEGNDRLFGQADNDTVSGGIGDDFVSGELGNDILNGGVGADRLFGSSGADTLSGGDDDDILYGGADNDRLDGGNGADKLTGGTGADIFAFDFTNAGTDRDTIFDFAIGSDKIEISGGLVYADLTFTASPNGQHTTISYNGHEIYVKNVTPAQLDAAQFTFIPLAEELGTGKAVVSEQIDEVGKPVVFDDDGFVFVDKPMVSDDLVGGSTDFGDFVIGEDALADFLSQAQSQIDIYINAEGILEIGPEHDGHDLGYFDSFVNFA